MIKSSSDNTTPRWKRSAAKGKLIGVRLQADHLAALDMWIDKQKEAFTRPEAIRRLVEIGLAKPSARPQVLSTSSEGAARAAEIVGKARDRRR